MTNGSLCKTTYIKHFARIKESEILCCTSAFCSSPIIRYTQDMASKSEKTVKQKSKTPPPKTNYPAAPHIIGMDWIELPSGDPKAAASLLVAMGFTPRGFVGKHPMVAIGGLVIMFKRVPSVVAMGVTPGPSSTTAAAHNQPCMTLQLTTDNITLKRQQLLALDLKPSPIKRQARGDMTFTWKNDDGLTLRFVGPLRD